MGEKIILVGGFHEVIELCEDIGYEIIGVIDNVLKDSYLGYPILGNDDDANDLYLKYKDIPLVITPDAPKVRENIYKHYSDIGFNFATIIGASARISRYATIGEGCVIQNGVNISSFVKIGRFVKLNTSSNVMHDCNLGDFVTVAPNAVILGRINVKEKVYIGSNSTILPELTIGEKSVVGAGSVVTKSVAPDVIVKGIPAK